MTKENASKDNSRVVKLQPKSSSYTPDMLLESAKGDYARLIVLGINHDGKLDPRASAGVCEGDVLWMIEQFKSNLLTGVYDGDDR